MESFVLCCARDVAVYCDTILELSLDYISYDPNYTDNMEEDTKESNGEEDEYVKIS